ncbi:MAG: CotH kinase family protein, partial [Clostridiales bacterium]|nr:CotH kinase family protein [Clostridiales bacterium]
MILNKHIPALSALLLCVCLVFCGLFVYAASASDAAYIPEYQKRLFGDEILTIDIQVAEESWQSLKGNAMAKEWICGDLVVNGQRFSSVGIRAKGNSSLMQVGRQENGRYSLQFKFNRFVKGQTCYGLDAFCINNMLGDATYMKDYLSYDIMKYIGVASPLANYANVTVNGEAYGFFVALERYEKAFLGRAFGTSSGQLYNVKIQMGMRQNFEDMFQDGLAGLPNWELGEFPDRQRGEFPDRQRGGMGGFPGRESGGGSLIYTGEDPERYSSIFNNAVFNRNSDKDKQRVITAIENLNAGTDLEKYFDVDAILRYFAAHTMVVNLDSYVSNMQQNYYIYERDGKLSILPWDYGLAFGGFQSGSAS